MVGSLVIFKLETTEVSKLTFENLLNKYLTGAASEVPQIPSVQETLRPNMEDDGPFAQLAVGGFLSVQSTPITCFREIGSTLWGAGAS